ncbi:RDD family protein [Mucilaginibacter sp. dw_454]|uniref:RDD family protein n=1 Tax=Mucilaginibacter sp. dw_454 TaxID=2720079 RepID=UPI001BD5D0AA|nr:RDD family protein [Mucilaginibacter sp. dw_454]
MAAITNTYILVINGKPEGPFSIDELKTRQIKPTDFVKTTAMDDYKEAHEVAELRELFGFKQQVLLQYYASFDQRATAAMVDWLIASAVCILPSFAITFFISDQLIGLGLALSMFALIPLVNLVYHIVMESSPKQATYGKQLLKVKVCDMQGNRLTLTHAAGRNVAKLLSVLTLFVGYLYAFFNKQQQCLHDRVAETLVIRDRL